MKTTIDKVGRLVIPRGMRAQVGLLEGGEVEVDIQGATIIVEPVAGDDLQNDGPFVVIPKTGHAISDADVREQRHADQR
jgi:AbrB family looped-hinge helix DNA binding protein